VIDLPDKIRENPLFTYLHDTEGIIVCIYLTIHNIFI